MVDFKNKEKDILDFWDKNRIFQKSVEKPAPQGDYLFYDGPPFATGTPHYGHLAASIMKDAVPRYWTMHGFRVERRWGWDCHGLPIENIVEKELGYKHKKDIIKLGIDKFNDLCRSKVAQYAGEWNKTIHRLARWVDMDNPYWTMDLSFMESVWWVFKQLWDRGLIYQDYRSMHICPRCETTLSQSEITEGYKDIKDLSLTAKFELVDEPGTYLLAWTTTPWTLIGNAALAIGQDIDYVKVESVGIKYILAKARLSAYEKDLGSTKVLGEIKGQDLVGKSYKPLFDFYAKSDIENRDNGWKIYAADFVTTEDGTGIVHIAPGFGEDDMNLGRAAKLPLINHVNMDGTIKSEAGEFAGLNVKPIDDVQSTDVKILKYLAAKSLLFSKEQYMHSYPHCWRCSTPLINYTTSSWFVSVTKIKKQLLKYAESINWSPAHIKSGRFGNWLEGARDWSISRQRFWASVMPIWQCEKCDYRMVFGSVADLEKESGQKINDLHKHVVDKITFPCHQCAATMRRIPDVLDTWFDSGSMPYAQFHYPFENKEKFDGAFPAHFIAEGADQTRAWFYYLHVIATAIKDKPAYKNVIVNGIVLAEDGKKMSKSLNNYPDPNLILEKYGADALRMYLLTSPVMLADNFNFSESDLQTTYRKFTGLLQNVLNFYLMFRGDKKTASEPPQSDNHLDKWIVSKLYQTQIQVSHNMTHYNLVKATRPIFDFVDALSTWYLRRSRDRFKGDDEQDRKNAIDTLGFVLKHLAICISPFAPFSAEIVYQEFENSFESVHLENWPHYREDLIDLVVLQKMDNLRLVAENVHALRAKHNLKVRQPLATLHLGLKSGLGGEKQYLDILADEVNVQFVDVKEDIGSGQGWVSAELGSFSIALDTNISEDLKDQGTVRELIRFINSLRKEAGLKPSDRPVEIFQTDSKYLEQVINKYKSDLVSGTSAADFVSGDVNQKYNKKCNIAGEEITLAIKE